MRSIIWLVDASFPVRQPGYCAAMRERFGDAAIRVTENHAKFVLVGNEQWLTSSVHFAAPSGPSDSGTAGPLIAP